MIGKVLKSTGIRYEIETENNQLVIAILKGKIRLKNLKSTNPVAVGDKVLLDNEHDEEGVYSIKEILPRINYIVRKATNLSKQKQVIAANVDLAILIFTWKEPQTHLLFIDRFLVSLESFRIPTLILFNKIDLLDENEKKEVENCKKIYQQAGYESILFSAKHPENIEEIKQKMRNKQVLISGNSGVGKSTLINLLEPNLSLKTNRISHASLQGQHTTTFAEMFHLSFDAYVMDTPGIKAFGLVEIEKEHLAHYFPEMRKELGKCKYYNCLHLKEPGCSVKQAVDNHEINLSRYKSYIQMMADDSNEIHRKDKYEE